MDFSPALHNDDWERDEEKYRMVDQKQLQSMTFFFEKKKAVGNEKIFCTTPAFTLERAQLAPLAVHHMYSAVGKRRGGTVLATS